MEDKELLQPRLAQHQPQVSGAVCAALYSVSHHSFEISHCNFGPEVIATTSVIPMSPEHNLRIHVRVRVRGMFYVLCCIVLQVVVVDQHQWSKTLRRTN